MLSRKERFQANCPLHETFVDLCIEAFFSRVRKEEKHVLFGDGNVKKK